MARRQSLSLQNADCIREMVQGGPLGLEPRRGGFDSRLPDHPETLAPPGRSSTAGTKEVSGPILTSMVAMAEWLGTRLWLAARGFDSRWSPHLSSGGPGAAFPKRRVERSTRSGETRECCVTRPVSRMACHAIETGPTPVRSAARLLRARRRRQHHEGSSGSRACVESFIEKDVDAQVRRSGSELREQRGLQNHGRGFDSFQARRSSGILPRVSATPEAWSPSITGSSSNGKTQRSQCWNAGSIPADSTGS